MLKATRKFKLYNNRLTSSFTLNYTLPRYTKWR